MLRALALTLLVFPLFLALPARAASHPTPLVDGDCSEYARLPAQAIDAGSGVTLYVYQDEHHVWLCYTYPPGSMGQLDMQVSTGKLAAPLNLHVSAQLGEWPVGRDDLTPHSPESDLWWNFSGWTANIIWLNGMDRSGPQPRYRWKNAAGRELQLAKQRFGHGEWKLALTIHDIKAADGKSREVRFPADGSFYTLKAL
ncbi:hypothetical protein NX773_19205 [Massilia solisilvae]|uniref:Uncharacterized protein n=1 Tax=Massilia solisilvae TaxID=1811225 RepID=A0ABT2BP59_9BURK|nr:hypothetical protein [Massilia solisilvae]MCS0610300.1 hypothetical protein [Massilia solisilvae]